MTRLMQGLTMASIKKNPALIPLYACIVGGCLWAGYYVVRLAVKSPEVSWNHRGNPEPWQEYRDGKQHKFYSPIRDYSKSPSQAPRYEE